MKTFKDIIAWKKGYASTLKIYQATAGLPRNEEFGLKSQMRRAAVSVVSNIAEGFKRRWINDSIHFCNLSESSLEELKCQTMLAFDLHYIDEQMYKELSALEDETGRLLYGWIHAQHKA